jgi:hypothetical protein
MNIYLLSIAGENNKKMTRTNLDNFTFKFKIAIECIIKEDMFKHSVLFKWKLLFILILS